MPSDTARSGMADIALWFADQVDPDECCRAFEAYGHAMAAAVALEQFMAVLIMKAYAFGLDKRAGKPFNKAEGPALIKHLQTCSYGRLLGKLQKCFTISNELLADLEDGKGFRDYLAHNFWAGHMGNLFSPEGVDVIAMACMQNANHFRLLTQALTKETTLDATDFIAMVRDAPDRAEKVEGWNVVLRDHGLL